MRVGFRRDRRAGRECRVAVAVEGGDKIPLLFAVGAAQHPFDGGGQVVVDDDFGNPAQSWLSLGKAITKNLCE